MWSSLCTHFRRGVQSHIQISSHSEEFLLNYSLYESIWDLWASRDLDCMGSAVRSHAMFFFFSFFFSVLKNVPIYFGLLGRMLQHCFVVKAQKCFEEFQTSHDLPPSRGRVDDDWISFSHGWTAPLSQNERGISSVSQNVPCSCPVAHMQVYQNNFHF